MRQAKNFLKTIHEYSKTLPDFRVNKFNRKGAVIITLTSGSNKIGLRPGTGTVVGRKSFRTSGIDAVPLCDNCEYTLGNSAKHDAYMKQLKAQPFAGMPDVQLVIRFLESDYRERIAKEAGVPFDEWSANLPKSDAVAFEVNGKILSEKYLAQTTLASDTEHGEPVMAIDCITGKRTLCTTRNMPKINLTQTPLTTVGMESACVIDTGSSACMLSEETESRIIQTLDMLMASGNTAHHMSNGDHHYIVFAMGNDRENENLSKLVMSLIGYEGSAGDTESNDEQAIMGIHDRLEGLTKGKPDFARIPGNVYIAKITRTCKGRHAFDYCYEIPAMELVSNIDRFFRDAEIVRPGSGDTGYFKASKDDQEHMTYAKPYYGMYEYARCMYASKASFRNESKLALAFSIIFGNRLPTSIAAKVSGRLGRGSAVPVTHRQASILKAVYNQAARINNKKELTTMLDKENSSRPYNLGRLLALVEYTQSAVNNVNRSIASMLYSSMSSGNSGALDRVNQLYMKYLGQLNARNMHGKAVYIEKIMAEITAHLDGSKCQVNSEYKELFAIGYHQQRAALYTPSGSESKE